MVSVFSDSKFYGETVSPDCPESTGEGTFCTALQKGGLLAGISMVGHEMELHPTMPMNLPHWAGHFVQQGAWGSKFLFKNLEFHNFRAKTSQGARQTAIRISPAGSDYIPLQEFENIKFINVEWEAIAYLFDPPEAWANVKDCGEFPCTAPKNVMYSFKGTTFERIAFPAGTAPPDLAALDTFQVVPDIPGYTEAIPTCRQEGGWNAYRCNTDGLGVLLFESEDPDKFDRGM